MQLGRGALLLVLNGPQADVRYKYLLDRLFCQNANQAVMEAGALLTALQLRHNIVTGRIAKIESLKTQITAVLASLTSALTIVIFFITNKQKPEPAPSPAAPEKRQRPASLRKRAADDR